MSICQFKNLCFGGCGTRGIAYVGVAKKLEEYGILQNIERCAGTSAGSISALLLSIGLPVDEIESIIKEAPFNEFMDKSWNIFSNLSRISTEFGWYKGEIIQQWIKNVIEERFGNPNITFADLSEIKKTSNDRIYHLYIIGTNITTGEKIVFSHETTPDCSIALALQISVSIPFVFKPVVLEGEYYIDGGLLWNLPIDLFDDLKYISKRKMAKHKLLFKKGIVERIYNCETLAAWVYGARPLMVGRKEYKPPRVEIESFYDYARTTINILMDQSNDGNVHPKDYDRIILIDGLGLFPSDFELTTDKICALIENGKKDTENYLTRFQSKDEDFYNRPSFFSY